MKIGDKITFRPTAWDGKTEFACGLQRPKAVKGRVIHVDRKGRFLVAEGQVDGRTIRETIMLHGG